MTPLLRLLRIYQKAGYTIRTGLNPCHFGNHIHAPFTCIYKDGKFLQTGGGIALQEVYFFEQLFNVYHPKRIFVIGNAFGWSTLLFAILNPLARTVAIDAANYGGAVSLAIDLTARLIEEEGLPAKIVCATSPQDVASVCKEHLGGPIDFAFIDGMHTDEQQELDYEAVAACASAECVYAFHDVIDCKMTERKFAN